MKEKFRINLGGEITEVFINFFLNQKIIRQNKVGDTYFITIKNGKDNLTYSIHENYYSKVPAAIRDYKLSNLLG
jgi:hypothetical protein